MEKIDLGIFNYESIKNFNLMELNEILKKLDNNTLDKEKYLKKTDEKTIINNEENKIKKNKIKIYNYESIKDLNLKELDDSFFQFIDEKKTGIGCDVYYGFEENEMFFNKLKDIILKDRMESFLTNFINSNFSDSKINELLILLEKTKLKNLKEILLPDSSYLYFLHIYGQILNNNKNSITSFIIENKNEFPLDIPKNILFNSKWVYNFFFNSLKNLKNLKNLKIEMVDFFENEKEESYIDIYELLKNFKKLTNLTIKFTNLSNKNLESLCKFIKESKYLKRINFNSLYLNKENDYQNIKIIKAVVENISIENIFFINFLKDYDIINLFEEIEKKNNKNIKFISVRSDDEITSEVIKIISDFLKMNKTLKYLDIENSHPDEKSYNADDLDYLKKSLESNNTIKKIYFDNNLNGIFHNFKKYSKCPNINIIKTKIIEIKEILKKNQKIIKRNREDKVIENIKDNKNNYHEKSENEKNEDKDYENCSPNKKKQKII